MRAIAIDDENLGLKRIAKLLKENQYFDYVKGYNESREAIENIEIDDPDIAFLDIEMPEIDGIDLAERLMEKKPDMEVVFVTAYNNYALQAFQVHAIGYLLKPVACEELNDIVERIFKLKNYQKASKISSKLYIQMFQDFNVKLDEDMTDAVKFRTEKARELLAFLLNSEGNPVSKGRIIDSLWPDMDIERATKNFHTTCYYIRKSFEKLGIQNLILRKQNGYCLNEEAYTSDLSIFRKGIKELFKERPNTEIIKDAFWKYKGAYLEKEDFLWETEVQTYYENSFESMGIYLEEYYEKADQDSEAEKILKYLLDKNPFSEKACDRLVKYYLKKGDKISADKVYRSYYKLVVE